MKIDDLTFYSMLSILQGGMWLLNDLELFLADSNMSHGRFSILLSIMESDGDFLLPINVSKLLGKSKPTITKMIKRLEDDEMVSCVSETDDKRTKKIYITDKGISYMNEIIPEYNKRIAKMSSKLTDADKRSIMKIISKVNFLDDDKKIMVL